jgi:hypothetical protein
MRTGQELLKEEMLAKLYAYHERMMARMDSQLEKIEAVVDVFEERLNGMDTADVEANRETSGAIVEQQDGPNEEAMVETIAALED